MLFPELFPELFLELFLEPQDAAITFTPGWISRNINTSTGTHSGIGQVVRRAAPSDNGNWQTL